MNKTIEMKVIKDGDSWCFVLPNFENLQVSPSCWANFVFSAELNIIYNELMEEVSNAS